MNIQMRWSVLDIGLFRDRLTAHDSIATSFIDIIKTSRAGTDSSEDDGLLIAFEY